MKARPAVAVGRVGALVLAMVALAPLVGGAQELDDLKTPPSPGFAVLGLSPTAIERPSTPVALGLGLISATDRGSLVPESYAVEFSPYWLTPKPFLTFEERHRPSFWQGVKQSFALSVATDRGAAGDSTRLGVGARVQLLAGRPSVRASAARARSDSLGILLTDVEERLRTAPTEQDSVELRREYEHLDTLVARLDSVVVAGDEEDRRGVRWELAGGVATSFPAPTFGDGDVTAWAVWSTFSIREWEDDLELLVLVRYQELEASGRRLDDDVEVGIEGQDVLDVGVRLLYGFGRLSASAELLGRKAFEVASPGEDVLLLQYGDSYRLTASAEYRLSDRFSFQWTFGRGFELAARNGGELVSLLGLKWAMGEGPALF